MYDHSKLSFEAGADASSAHKSKTKKTHTTFVAGLAAMIHFELLSARAMPAAV